LGGKWRHLKELQRASRLAVGFRFGPRVVALIVRGAGIALDDMKRNEDRSPRCLVQAPNKEGLRAWNAEAERTA